MKKIQIDKNILYQLYIIEQKSSNEIGKILNCSGSHIVHCLSKYNIKTRNNKERGKIQEKFYKKYTKNKDFFSKPTIKNCYWAGFIAADGCISNNNAKQKLSICVQSLDRIILEQFIKDIKYNGIILDRITKPTSKSFIQKEYYQSTVQICDSTEIIDDLKKHWNITERKSLTLQPPNLIKLEHKLAYIIGYIDGDGSIGINITKYNKNILSLRILGTKELLNWIIDTFSCIENNKYKRKNIFQRNKIYVIDYSDNRGYYILQNLIKFIKKHKLPILKRKWNKIEEYEQQKINLASSMG